jgi:hypothetical protein
VSNIRNWRTVNVIRGLEAGGSAGDIGRYVTFADEVGEPLEYLHPVETIAVNGLHAVVLSKAMLRADMLRKVKTYELLITRHWLSLPPQEVRGRTDFYGPVFIEQRIARVGRVPGVGQYPGAVSCERGAPPC